MKHLDGRSRGWWSVLVLVACGIVLTSQDSSAAPPPKRVTVDERVAEHGEQARARLAPLFAEARIPYPPQSVTLVGLKRERQVQLYATSPSGVTRFIRSYPVLGASGQLGPKLAEGDFQVPEGIYRIEALNSNSLFHLSLRVDYPNGFDRARAKEEGRRRLGSDIMIHGGGASTGCLSIGNPGIEELFVLAADVGRANVSVILTPFDLRSGKLTPELRAARPWTPQLYGQIQRELAMLPLPKEQGVLAGR